MSRMIRALRGLMQQTVDIEPKTGENRRGKPTYGSATTYRCRISGKRRRVIDSNGQEVVSSQTIYLASGDQVQPEDRVTLSTADVGSTEDHSIRPPIVATSRHPDETGQNVYTAIHLR